MKRSPANSFFEQLNRIKGDLDAFVHPETMADFVRNLDEFIVRLNTIRAQLTSSPLEKKLLDIGKPLEQVIEFLEFAKANEVLGALLTDAVQNKNATAKRAPIEIPLNLRNDEIRELLAQDLSKGELKAVAVQRGISVGKANVEELKREILDALDRQEGYERLAMP